MAGELTEAIDRSLFHDVEPILEKETDEPVVEIAYSEEYEYVSGLMRAILANNEVSERARRLTSWVIRNCAAHYTAWVHRRRCLWKELCSLADVSGIGSAEDDPDEVKGFPSPVPASVKERLEQERAFCDTIALSYGSKNYQLWHHRRVLTAWDGNAEVEREFTRLLFRTDAKHYHAWAHRQWIARRFPDWEAEFGLIREQLAADVRNNSAWNHRWFALTTRAHLPDEDGDEGGGEGESGGDDERGVVPPRPKSLHLLPLELRRREVAFAIETTRVGEEEDGDVDERVGAPRMGVLGNEAALNYLRGLMRGVEGPISAAYPQLWKWVGEMRAQPRGIDSLTFQAFVVDVLLAEPSAPAKEQARTIIQHLMEKDVVRSTYWEWRSQCIGEM